MTSDANLPLNEIARRMGVVPQYVLVIVTQKQGETEQVVHCDLRELPDALAIYDALTQQTNQTR